MIKTLRTLGFVFGFIFCAQTASAQMLDAVIALKSRVPMMELAAAVTNPSSPRYRKFFSPEEIRQIAAPSAEQVGQLIASLREQGLQVIHVSPSRLSLTVRGDQTAFERSFHTQIEFLTEARHALTAPIEIPEALSLISNVDGLSNVNGDLRPRLVVSQVEQPRFSSGEVQGYYGFNPIYQKGITGKGQHIAIAGYDQYFLNDIRAYFQKSRLPSPQIDAIPVGTGKAPGDVNSAVETAADAELSGMIAPGAMIHLFIAPTPDDLGEVSVFTAIVDDNRSKIVNYSWGSCESQTDAPHRKVMEDLFARAVAQGINVFNASGDTGSNGCNDTPPKVNATWPASLTTVIAVGGTTMNYNADSKTFSETAWSGSGGGVSDLYDLPPWQSAFPAPFRKRSIPDVAFNADPNSPEAVFSRSGMLGWGHWMALGGTSIAAPQWSGFMALVGEARKGAPLGLLTPILYGMNAATQSQVLTDITQGSNGAYSAGPGWDAVTGLGSPKASALLDALASH
jgi:kumamolisin